MSFVGAYRYRGRHRAPSTAGRTATRLAVAGVAVALPLALAQPASAAPDSTWDRLAQCESSGRWDLNVGLYDGGLQYLPTTWRGFGGGEFAPAAHQATRAEQIVVAERVLAKQGWSAWPVCSRKVGARGEGVTPRKGEPRPAARDSSAARTYQKARAATPRSSPRPGAPARSGGGDTHVVRAGDTLAEVASEHNTTWRAIYHANRGVVERADLIFPGERLQLP